ncbi:unnamed protein product, partial [Darwinula stevensoni]
CSKLGSVTGILDLTWEGWDPAKTLASQQGLVYLHLDVTNRQYVQAAENYLYSQNGSDAALIFGSQSESDQSLYYIIGNSLLRVMVLNRLDEAGSARLRRLKPTPAYYAIFAGRTDMQSIFADARKGNLVTRDSRWALTFTDFTGPEEAREVLDPSLSVPLTTLTLQDRICCLVAGQGNCTCQQLQVRKEFVSRSVKAVAAAFSKLKASGVPLTTKSIECPVPNTSSSSDNTRGRFEAAFKEETARPDSFVKRDGDGTARPVLRFQLHSHNGTTREKLGNWTLETGFAPEPGYTAHKIRPRYRVGTILDRPWAFDLPPGSPDPPYDGFCIQMLKRMSELMEFDFDIVVPAIGTYGAKQEDGSWDGLIGDLYRGETDMIVAPLTMTSEREEVVDFVAPYFDQSGIGIVIRKPHQEPDLFKFMTVLRLEVWLSILAALLVTGILIWLLDTFSPYSAQNNKELYPYECRKFTLSESLWFALTSFTPQGGGEAPRALSGRILVAAYWLFVVLMLATFTANLAAFLTVERMQNPIGSLEELAHQSKVNYTVQNGTSTKQYFENMANAEDELYRMWKEMALNGKPSTGKEDPNRFRVWDYPVKERYTHMLKVINDVGPVASRSDGYSKVRNTLDGSFAFLDDVAHIRYEVNNDCNLLEVGDPFAEQPYAIAVQQGSHLQDEISKTILTLQKDRFFETLQSQFWNSSKRGPCPNTNDSEGITLQSLGGVFIATLVGLAIAMATLGVEVYLQRKRQGKVTDKGKARDKDKSPARITPRVSIAGIGKY